MGGGPEFPFPCVPLLGARPARRHPGVHAPQAGGNGYDWRWWSREEVMAVMGREVEVVSGGYIR